MFFAGDRFAAVEPDGWIRVIPDLIVEVLSPGTEEYDRTQKRALYARLGGPHYWMADPRSRTLAECVLQPGGVYGERTVDVNTPFQPAIFPDLVIDLAQIFE